MRRERLRNAITLGVLFGVLALIDRSFGTFIVAVVGGTIVGYVAEVVADRRRKGSR